MADYLDIVLDWLDGLLPGLVVFANDQIIDLKDKNSLKIKIIRLSLNIIKGLYLISSLYTLYYIKYVKKENFFMVRIGTKIITTSISLLLILGTIMKLFKTLF